MHLTPAASGRAPIRDAATVMLLREGQLGPEVFMLRRSLTSAFVGGVYVFPGGAVDDDDRDARHASACLGRTDAQASADLGIGHGGLAYWWAAVRECFEEAGLLLAYGPDGAMISFEEPATAQRFSAHRRAVDRGERSLAAICEEEGLRVATDAIHYFSHWITPAGAPRRYDTRFFVSGAPPAQEGVHDDRETIASLWIRPSDALERFRLGEFELILPTIKCLEALSRFDNAADLLDAAGQRGEIPAILPPSPAGVTDALPSRAHP